MVKLLQVLLAQLVRALRFLRGCLHELEHAQLGERLAVLSQQVVFVCSYLGQSGFPLCYESLVALNELLGVGGVLLGLADESVAAAVILHEYEHVPEEEGVAVEEGLHLTQL